MKKTISVLLAAAMLALSLVGCGGTQNKLEQIQANGYITLAVSPDFAPSEFKNPQTGEVLGSDIFVAQYVADYLSEKFGTEIELRIEEMDFKACQAAIASGSADFSLNGYAATDERKENYYCSVHYGKTEGESYQGFLMMADGVEAYTTAESFSGKTVAVQLSSLQQNLCTAQLPEDVNYELITTVTQGALMLTTGKVDALATTSDTGSLLMLNYEGIAMAPFQLDYTSEGSVALINIDQPELGAAIDEALNDMLANVNFTEIRQQYTDMAAELGVTNE